MNRKKKQEEKEFGQTECFDAVINKIRYGFRYYRIKADLVEGGQQDFSWLTKDYRKFESFESLEEAISLYFSLQVSKLNDLRK